MHVHFYKSGKLNILALISITIFLFQSTYTLGQTLSLKDMTNLVDCPNYHCFNDFITRRGFSATEITKRDELIFNYVYNSDEKYINTSNKNFNESNYVFFQKYKSGNLSVILNTGFKEHYLNLLDELANLKFIPKNTKDEEKGAISVEYTSDQYVDLTAYVTTIFHENNGERWVRYQISFWKAIK